MIALLLQSLLMCKAVHVTYDAATLRQDCQVVNPTRTRTHTHTHTHTETQPHTHTHTHTHIHTERHTHTHTHTGDQC